MYALRASRRVIALAGVPVALFIALAAWALASPVGSSPDDDYHLASIWCGRGIEPGLCEKGLADDQRFIPQFLNKSPCYKFYPENSAGCQGGIPTRLINTDRGNFSGNYPPVFYTTMSYFAGTDIAKSVIVMRLVNSALFVGAVTALFFMLKPGRRGPLVWGSLVTIVPLGAFLIPSQNPSSWSVIAAATLWVALVGYWQSPTTRSSIGFGALATLLAVMASGARADSAAYTAMTVVVTAILAAPRSRASAVRAILPACLVVVAAVFFLTAGDSGIVVRDATVGNHSLRAVIELTAVNLMNMPALWAGVFGTRGLGWLDTYLPSTVWVTMIGIMVAIVFFGLRVLNRRKALALATVFAALIVVPLYILVAEGLVVGHGVQPRYAYPLMILLAGIATLGFQRDDLGLNPTQLWVVGVGVVIANTVALHTNMRRYLTGINVHSLNLDAGREWWWDLPVLPNTVWAVGAVSFAAAVAGLLVALRRSSTHESCGGDLHVDARDG